MRYAESRPARWAISSSRQGCSGSLSIRSMTAATAGCTTARVRDVPKSCPARLPRTMSRRPNSSTRLPPAPVFSSLNRLISAIARPAESGSTLVARTPPPSGATGPATSRSCRPGNSRRNARSVRRAAAEMHTFATMRPSQSANPCQAPGRRTNTSPRQARGFPCTLTCRPDPSPITAISRKSWACGACSPVSSCRLATTAAPVSPKRSCSCRTGETAWRRMSISYEYWPAIP